MTRSRVPPPRGLRILVGAADCVRFGPDGFDQESVYSDTNGNLDTTTLHFVRAPEP